FTNAHRDCLGWLLLVGLGARVVFGGCTEPCAWPWITEMEHVHGQLQNHSSLAKTIRGSDVDLSNSFMSSDTQDKVKEWYDLVKKYDQLLTQHATNMNICLRYGGRNRNKTPDAKCLGCLVAIADTVPAMTNIEGEDVKRKWIDNLGQIYYQHQTPCATTV
ncbi:hypothetical protein, partial [Salmonella enterica]|uniref:hypothetical protein n=1 Tax=Salmonella enterica TaxID=28901 RepID=UPI00135E5D28